MILVTGSSGFLGKAISDRLGDEAVNLSRISSDNGRHHILFDLAKHERADELAAQLKSNGITQIIHAAAVTPWSSSKPDYSLDLDMAKTLAIAAEVADIDRIMYLSGWNVYDMQSGQPPHSETTPVVPTEDYGKSKLNVEKYFEQNLKSVKLTILRLASIYGPGQTSSGLIPNLVNSALTTKSITVNAKNTRRDYLYVDDLVEAIQKVVVSSSMPKVMNMGSGVSVSVEEVANTVQTICKREFGLEITINYTNELNESPLADNRLSIDVAQAQGLLTDNTSFEIGLEQYIAWAKHENIF